MATPAPIDPRGPRFNQAVLATALLLGFLADWRPVVPIFALVLLAGAALGPKYGPFLALYGKVIRPRLAPPTELEDPRPPRFAAAVGVALPRRRLPGLRRRRRRASAGAWPSSSPPSPPCPPSPASASGCEIYLLAARRRPVTTLMFLRPGRHRRRHPLRRGPGRPALPVVAGRRRRTTSPCTPAFPRRCSPAPPARGCSSRRPTAPPAARSRPGCGRRTRRPGVVKVDATREPHLADAFSIRSAPTVLLADGAGNVTGSPGRRRGGRQYVAADVGQWRRAPPGQLGRPQ